MSRHGPNPLKGHTLSAVLEVNAARRALRRPVDTLDLPTAGILQGRMHEPDIPDLMPLFFKPDQLNGRTKIAC